MRLPGFLVSDARHHNFLLRSKNEIESSLDLMKKKRLGDLIEIGLHNAIRYLGHIVGETATEDMHTKPLPLKLSNLQGEYRNSQSNHKASPLRLLLTVTCLS
jgi:hypothetical protein